MYICVPETAYVLIHVYMFMNIAVFHACEHGVQ